AIGALRGERLEVHIGTLHSFRVGQDGARLGFDDCHDIDRFDDAAIFRAFFCRQLSEIRFIRQLIDMCLQARFGPRFQDLFGNLRRQTCRDGIKKASKRAWKNGAHLREPSDAFQGRKRQA
ncbi:MAG TPA: hypothetical protein VFW87_25295, partial [Pirellulales bacterium]|nr:hypothetical protein [Pirellulales bacterium]